MRFRQLWTWLTVLGLFGGFVISSLLAPVVNGQNDPLPITLKMSTDKPVVDEPFQVELIAQTPIGKDYSVVLPEHLTVNQGQLRKKYHDLFKEIDYDQQQRKLTVTFKTTSKVQRFKMSVVASRAQQYELQAGGQLPGPAVEEQQSAEELQTSKAAAEDLPTTFRESQSEPLKVTVAPAKTAASSSSGDSEPTGDQASKSTEKSAATANENDSVTSSETSDAEKTGSQNQATGSQSAATDTEAAIEKSEKAATGSTQKQESNLLKDQKIAAVKPKVATKSVALAANTSVTTYAELKAAYADSDVTEITLANDITTDTNPPGADLATRTTSIKINGNNKVLDMGRANFRIGVTTGTQTIRVENFKSIRASATTGTGAMSSYGIVQNGVDSAGTTGSKWIAQFADITTHADVLRLASVAGNQLEIYGTVNATTVWETAVTSGVKVADNAALTARKSRERGEDRSFFWFPSSPISGVGDRRFVIGDGATVDCQGAVTDDLYPVVYLNYDELIVGTGATYIAKMYGYAYNAQQSSNIFTAKENSKVIMENMLENGARSAVNFDTGLTRTAQFTVKAGSEFYATNRSRAPVFGGGNLLGVNILLESPQKYDIQNTSTGLTTAVASIVNLTIGSFRITNANLSMWSVTLPVSVNAKATYQNVTWIEQKLAIVTSSHGGLLTALFSFSVSRRINNTLSIPTAEYSSPYAADLGKALVTNADKKVRLRVILGYNESGETAVPIYAGANDAKVELTDDQGAKHVKSTEAAGYVNFDIGRFLTAGKELQATVTTSFTADPVTITVQDKTPPTPVKVKNNQILADQTQMAGENAEAGQVRYTVNGASAVDDQNAEITDTVSGSGTWQMQRATPKWKANDEVQLLIKDAAGNENPTATTNYHDATFAAATKYVVQPANGPTPPTQPESPGSGPATETENPGTGNTGELRLDYAPSNFNFGEVTTSWFDRTYSAKPISGVSKQWLQVSDNRLNQHGWSVKVRQSQPFTSQTGKLLNGAVIKLPAGKTYNEKLSTGLQSHALDVTAADQTVFGANNQSTVGKELSTNVWQPEAVQLKLPGGTAENGQTYTGSVSWTLTSEVSF